ncbi:MAG: hypothetical protein KAR11_01700 [Phycisphaerae bacterium]|nr:hypothetical protein [Phycisphaerae bacterium]
MSQKIPISPPPFAQDVVARLTELLQTLTAGKLPEIPPLADCLNVLTNMNFLYGLGLGIIGLVYLLRGWKVFKMLVALNAATIGGVAGAMIMIQLGMQDQWWIGMLIGAGVLGVLSWPLISIFIAVFGAGAGAALGYSAFYQIVTQLHRGDLVPFAWVAAIAGAILIAILTFVIFRQCVVILTAAQGGVMLTAGSLCLLFKHPTLHEIISVNILKNPSWLFVIVLSFTIIGLIVQFVNTNREKQAAAKKSSSSQSS